MIDQLGSWPAKWLNYEGPKGGTTSKLSASLSESWGPQERAGQAAKQLTSPNSRTEPN